MSWEWYVLAWVCCGFVAMGLGRGLKLRTAEWVFLACLLALLGPLMLAYAIGTLVRSLVERGS